MSPAPRCVAAASLHGINTWVRETDTLGQMAWSDLSFHLYLETLTQVPLPPLDKPV